MEQQRARRDALKAKRKAAKTVETKKQSAYDKYFADNKGQKGVTRGTSNDASKKPLVLAPEKTEAKKPSKPPVRSSKTPKPASKPTPTKSNKERASSRFYSSSSGTYGKPLPSNPQLKSQSRTKQVSGQGGNKRTVNVKPTLQKPTKPKRNRRGRRVG